MLSFAMLEPPDAWGTRGGGLDTVSADLSTISWRTGPSVPPPVASRFRKRVRADGREAFGLGQPRQRDRGELARQAVEERDDVLRLRVAQVATELRLGHDAH